MLERIKVMILHHNPNPSHKGINQRGRANLSRLRLPALPEDEGGSVPARTRDLRPTQRRRLGKRTGFRGWGCAVACALLLVRAGSGGRRRAACAFGRRPRGTASAASEGVFGIFPGLIFSARRGGRGSDCGPAQSDGDGPWETQLGQYRISHVLLLVIWKLGILGTKMLGSQFMSMSHLIWFRCYDGNPTPIPSAYKGWNFPINFYSPCKPSLRPQLEQNFGGGIL